MTIRCRPLISGMRQGVDGIAAPQIDDASTCSLESILKYARAVFPDSTLPGFDSFLEWVFDAPFIQTNCQFVLDINHQVIGPFISTIPDSSRSLISKTAPGPILAGGDPATTIKLHPLIYMIGLGLQQAAYKIISRIGIVFSVFGKTWFDKNDDFIESLRNPSKFLNTLYELDVLCDLKLSGANIDTTSFNTSGNKNVEVLIELNGHSFLVECKNLHKGDEVEHIEASIVQFLNSDRESIGVQIF